MALSEEGTSKFPRSLITGPTRLVGSERVTVITGVQEQFQGPLYTMHLWVGPKKEKRLAAEEEILNWQRRMTGRRSGERWDPELLIFVMVSSSSLQRKTSVSKN